MKIRRIAPSLSKPSILVSVHPNQGIWQIRAMFERRAESNESWGITNSDYEQQQVNFKEVNPRITSYISRESTL